MRLLYRTLPFAVAALALTAVAVFAFRAPLRDAKRELAKPELPPAINYQETAMRAPALAAPTSTSRVNAPGPLPTKKIPTSINLAVPFLSQAPKKNWDMPYQEACEETSSIMVDAYYKGRRASFASEEGDKAILDLIAYENSTLGFYKDTTAEQTADFIRGYFHDAATVSEVNSADDIRAELAAGHPVIVPASGKMLGNPNFRNGGPLYHMLVIKGYLADGRWITNDPGTRLGADYVYDQDVLMKAIHDWNGGDVTQGKPLMIVITPNPS